MGMTSLCYCWESFIYKLKRQSAYTVYYTQLFTLARLRNCFISKTKTYKLINHIRNNHETLEDQGGTGHSATTDVEKWQGL